MKFGIKTFSAVTALCAGMAFSSAQAALVTVDDFSSGIFEAGTALEIDGVGTAAGQQLGTMLGGERDVYLRVTAAVAGSPDASAEVQTGVGEFEYSNRIGAQSDFLIQWDGSDGQTSGGADYDNPTGELSQGLGGIDLTMGGMFDAFGTLFTLDGNTVESFVMLFSSAGDSSVHFFDKEGPETGFQHFAKFNNSGAADAFTVVSGAGADFTSITAIVIGGRAAAGSAGTGLNLQLDLIDSITVPEPATLALFGAGLVGIGAIRRRRKAAA